MHSTLAILALSLSGVLSAPTTRSCTGPKINSATLSLIEEFEGFSAKEYKDAGGHPTIGYGHLCKKSDCSEIPYPIPLSKADGRKLLQSDTDTAKNCITTQTASSVKLNANQYGALVSWAFNVGCGATGSSNLIARLNKGDKPNTVAKAELPKWNKVNGVPVEGLTRRRAAEVDLFTTASSVAALPVGC
ncbi:lysozyme [Xylariales sp. AK1849]|nr:lysozyme [Xylariales sp. AK1849]